MNPSRNSITCPVNEETFALPLTPNMMKNLVISAFALLAFLSSCTPARQVAQSTPTKASSPAFKTWVAHSSKTTETTAVVKKTSSSPHAKSDESLEASYAKFRKKNASPSTENSGTLAMVNSHEPQKSTPSPAPVSPKATFRTSPTQPLPANAQEDPEVIRVYIDSNKPVVVKLIEGTPDGIQIIREVAVPPKGVKYQYPHMKKEAVKAPEKIDPAVLKSAPYVQEETPKVEDPQDFMMAMMEDKLTEAQEEPVAQTRAAQPVEELPMEIKKIITPTPTKSHLVPVYLSGTQSITIDENLLRQWEKKIVDARMGMESSVKLPRWLLQGLEWVTHAEKVEPKRSETIMPLYRELEARGHLDGINLNQMTPVQVIRKIRILVDELKASNGQLSMN